ncbi:MAG: alpha/beta hydrolase [Woeseiaceae bacterium]|nr:alpha/beta hydrolase [Woeseiaceae bacterium]
MIRNASAWAPALALLSLALSGPAPALELEDCRISAGPSFPGIKARCGTLERPLDPDDADAGSISLRVAVVPALNLQPEPDPVVPLAGGPGQGAVQFYSAYANAFEPVRRNRDILLVDQRGTGESSRMDCPFDEDVVEGQFSVEQTVAYMKDCLEALPHDPRFFTTSVAVQDLEAVREALGYPALNLYGVSYGTRVAQHFARRYPDVTRTIVLDGVVPPQLALGPEIATESQKAVDNILARCADDEACAGAFPDIAAQFASVRARLSANPARVKLAHPITGQPESLRFGRLEFAAAVRMLAYSPHSIAIMPLLISEAADGNLQPLAAQYAMTLISMSETLAIGMHNSVMCTEDAPFFDRAGIDRAALEASYMGPFQLEALQAICSVWPAGPIDEDFKRPLSTAIPTLLLSGSADPITPPRYADMAAAGLRKAWLLTGEHQGHGQIAVGCMPRIVDDFISKQAIADADIECMQRTFVMPFFVDFTGPTP